MTMMKMKTKTKTNARKRKARARKAHPSVAQTTGTDPSWAAAQESLAAVQEGVRRLTPSRDELLAQNHALIGRSLLAGVSVVLPRVLSAVTAARKAFRKPTGNAKARARRVAKIWGV